jgi:hypothetical protein
MSIPTNIALSLHFFFIRKRKGLFTKENHLKIYNHTSILGVKGAVRGEKMKRNLVMVEEKRGIFEEK